MNPITNAKNLNKLNERELDLGLTGSKTSWHNLYEESAWIFIGGLAYDMTEGDVIAVFSQYGEIVNINMVRDKKTGKPKGYCFLCYEDQRSTNLAVDNFNGIKLLNRILRVDHVKDYRMPKEFGDEDEVTKQVRSEGCGPDAQLTRTSAPVSPEHKEKKKAKKRKIKTETFSDPEGENTSRQERISERFHAKEIKQEVLSDNEVTGTSSRRNATNRSADSDSDRSIPHQVKTESDDHGYNRHDDRQRSPDLDRKGNHRSKFDPKHSERYETNVGRRNRDSDGRHRKEEDGYRSRGENEGRSRGENDGRSRDENEGRSRGENEARSRGENECRSRGENEGRRRAEMEKESCDIERHRKERTAKDKRSERLDDEEETKLRSEEYSRRRESRREQYFDDKKRRILEEKREREAVEQKKLSRSKQTQ